MTNNYIVLSKTLSVSDVILTSFAQSIPGLVVEVSSRSCDAESQVGDESEWMVVNSSELLDEMMVS